MNVCPQDFGAKARLDAKVEVCYRHGLRLYHSEADQFTSVLSSRVMSKTGKAVSVVCKAAAAGG